MKKQTILSKRILRDLEKYKSDEDSYFNIDKLLENKCLYFEMEDYYGFNENIQGSGELKQKTIEVLLNIYLDWQAKLTQLKLENYLAIWIYLPRLSQSQVVCGIQENIDYYKNDVFLTGNQYRNFDPSFFGKISKELKNFTWKLNIDLDNVTDWEVNFPKQNYESLKEYHADRRKHKKNISKSIKIIKNPDGENMYLFPSGDVWVGQLANNL